jgi:hypothetical protein
MLSGIGEGDLNMDVLAMTRLGGDVEDDATGGVSV